MQCIRVSDGRSVADSEAFDAAGALKQGYSVRKPATVRDGEHVSFSMAFRDAASTGVPASLPKTFGDAAITFTDAEQSAILARAQMMHRMSTAYLGDHAPPFNHHHATIALTQAADERSRWGANAPDPVEVARLATASQVARDAMIGRLQRGDQ